MKLSQPTARLGSYLYYTIPSWSPECFRINQQHQLQFSQIIFRVYVSGKVSDDINEPFFSTSGPNVGPTRSNNRFSQLSPT